MSRKRGAGSQALTREEHVRLGTNARNARRRQQRAAETPQARDRRLQNGRARTQIRREQSRSDMQRRLDDLGTQSVERVTFTDDEIRFMGEGQKFTSDPRVALAYFYCCGADPGGFVYGNEVLNTDDGRETRERLGQLFGDKPGANEIAACQKLVAESASESSDIWACASCGRMLTGSSQKVIFCRLQDLHVSFLLDDDARAELFDGATEATVRKYRQFFFCNGKIYYMIPELVRDKNCIPICEKCSPDPLKNPFSVASGHDYGRVGNLPGLSQVALDCIAPVRCFGMDISLSHKHSSGHSICFPSDGPSKIAAILPRVGPDCVPRVTFVGPKEEWRIQQKRFRKLYSIPVDDIYEWLGVLGEVNSVFRDEHIFIDATDGRRSQLHGIADLVEASVEVTESRDVSAVQDLAVSERYGQDIDDRAATDVGAGEGLVVQQSAVLPSTQADSHVHGVIDVLLDTLPRPPEAVLPTCGSSTPTARREEPPVIPVKRGPSPVVEWMENAKMIAGVFPDLFLTGSGPLPSGPLSRSYVDHFMNYWDGRFEKSTRFLAVLFNQMQRHTAVRNAARLSTARSGTLKSFGKLASTRAFREALELAKADPDSSHAVRLNAILLRLLSLVGGTVPFSPFERVATRPKLGAMRFRYGVGQHWVTMAPPEHDDLLLHRIAQLRKENGWNDASNALGKGACTFSDLPLELQQSARARLAVSNVYPALSAQVFERKLEIFTKCLMRCCDSCSTRVSRNVLEREPGVFGRVAGFSAVVEPQVDGRLHAHAIVYGSSVSPLLLTRASACPELWPRVRQWMESVSCTSVSDETRSWCNDWRDSHHGKTPRTFEIDVPSAINDYTGFIKAAERRAFSTNVHSHSQTCRKGGRGTYMCRLSRPAGVHEDATQPLLVRLQVPSQMGKRKRAVFEVESVCGSTARQIDQTFDGSDGSLLPRRTDGAVVWEQRRPPEGALFVETNLALACLSGSHTNSAVINGQDAGDMVEEYQHSYMTKEKGGLKSSAAVMLSAIRDMEKYPSVASDSGTHERQAKYLATRTVNAFTGATEWPHQLMAYALAGYKSYVSSDTFWYVFPHQLVAHVKETISRDQEDGGVETEDEHACDSDSGAGPSVSVCNDYEDGFAEEETFEGGYIQERLERLVHTSAGNDGYDKASSPRGSGTRMYTIGKETFFVSQAESYRHRGKWFEDYSPVEFEMIVDILPKVEDNGKAVSVRRGRPRRKGFELAPGHPLSQRFQAFIRTKFRSPMLGGSPTPPLAKDGQPSTALSNYILCLMLPWGLDSGTPGGRLDPTHLAELCRRWNRVEATFINRGRYRLLANLLRKQHRSARNEKACSEWRSRNADFWTGEISRPPIKRQRLSPATAAEDRESGGWLPPEELLDFTIAAAAKNLRAVANAKSMRATFWALDPASGGEGPALDPHREVAPELQREVPIYYLPNGAPTLAQTARSIQTMPPPEALQRRDPSGISITPRGDSPPDKLASRDDDCEERLECSLDQRAVFDRVIGSIQGNGAMHQTLSVLHGGGGTGKSKLMRLISGVLMRHGIHTVNTCPTGIGACQLVDGRTFHSTFKTFRKGDLSANDLELLRLTFTREVALVIIDEVSMFCAEFLALLDKRLRAIYRSNVVFGGRSSILAGDFLQLDVTCGTPLCKVLYMNTTSAELLSARALFRKFDVYFLTSQHRAAGCSIQQANLSACRDLPLFFPSGQRWSEAEAKAYRPMTPAVVESLTSELTVDDVANDPAWVDDLTILVTSNVDKAILTSCAARRFARRRNQFLFRWKRLLRRDLPLELQRLVYDEDANPELFSFFVAGAPARVLDNTNGNVGWGVANGSPCRYHSLAWNDKDKQREVDRLIERARQEKVEVIDLPFPPDFINVELLDSNGETLAADDWPPACNLESNWEYSADGVRQRKTRVLIPIGVMKSNSGNRSVSLGQGFLDTPTSLAYIQHAVDLAFVVTVWKAQGCTLRRVLLFLEPSRPHAPKWGFEHLYVGLSRVTSAAYLRCFPLSGAFRKSNLFKLRPNIYTTKWRLQTRAAGARGDHAV